MSITLYTGQNCNRCTILKDYLTSKCLAFTAYDFQGDGDVFSVFYRKHRAKLHRDSENRLEIPIYDDGKVVRQGVGEVLAYLLAGEELDGCVGTSWIMHGWISNINVSACPTGQEEHFLALLRLLTAGGLKVILDADGRRPELLEQVLNAGLAAKLLLNIAGPARLYPAIAGGPVTPGDLKKSVALARAFADSVIRIPVAAHADAAGMAARITPAEAGEAAEMLLAASGDAMLPAFVEAGPAGALPPLTAEDMLAYRLAARKFLPKAEIRKPETH